LVVDGVAVRLSALPVMAHKLLGRMRAAVLGCLEPLGDEGRRLLVTGDFLGASAGLRAFRRRSV
jgi:hypothetical protein